MDEESRLKSGNRESAEREAPSHTVSEQLPDIAVSERSREAGSQEIVRRVQEARNREVTRKRWGYVLFILGIVTVLNSCSMVPIPLMGPVAVWVGAIMAAGGAGLLASRSRMRDTNEAIMVAMKYGNRLTVARLSLEMDISLKKSERIIRKLVKSGIAEIDLDQDKPDDGIVYKVKGI